MYIYCEQAIHKQKNVYPYVEQGWTESLYT